MPILQSSPYDTLTDAINELQAKGYDQDFNQKENCLECKALKKEFQPEDFTIVHTYRFEGMSSAGDNSVLYAIEASDGTKGLLVDAYGVYADSLSPEMIEKFRVEYQDPDQV
ncbi:phosphoribosylpyrophosphate synthetase [Lewinella sp. W8]|uniref:phosphoribosylpyrophosphate synthetase n=1 Tax=Lewinella sp. W8 TaxID=2528208 RepID=UPI001067F432|nr:phosphoribosylpyrophosphate synthetase [Lewinella sp. W8]MTB49420.1 phosphoribosylpyrophosphate synthetase [Lewinella sp. W8]